MKEQVTKLGMAKVYFTKEDFGKMLKLKDPTNLEIIDIEKDEYGDIVIKLATTMDNVVNNRVKAI